MGNDVFTTFLVFTAYISIHVPAWGTTYNILLSALFTLFQSTFPRGERLASAVLIHLASKISIHVPAWGTTKASKDTTTATNISIHVPAWGTTNVKPTLH